MKFSVTLLVSLSTLAFGIGYQPASPPREVYFGRDVVPILSRCFKCHGFDVAKAAGGLRLDTFAEATKNKAIVPGSPAKSLLIQRASSKDPDLHMPPKDSGVKSFTASELETLRTWIKAGAKYEKHWAYVPPKMPALPKVSNPLWAKNLLDTFVLAKLDEAKLKPEPEADRDTLALRASLTLTGLQPTPAQLNAFRTDTKPGAYERYVDRLLASKAYGEHEARYWLDAVRYGDTHGLQLDNERGVYPYRDWVVRAHNEDLPFTKFVEWQLAGDLLPKPTTEQLIATGYVRMNITSGEGGAIPEEFLARNTFDRVDTTSTVFMGLTVGCAKCHDHKYDPIKQKEYYGLYAFFDNTKDEPLDGNIALPPPFIRAATPKDQKHLAQLDHRLASMLEAVDSPDAKAHFTSQNLAIPTTRGWELSEVYTAKSFDEAFDRVEPAETGKGQWKPFNLEIGKSYFGIIGKDAASIYLSGTVNFAKAQSFTFGVSSDDAVKVWLNGKLIHTNKVSRGVETAIDKVTGYFEAGDNQFLMKVTNGAGPDGLNLRLFDANAKRIDDALKAYAKDPNHKALAAAFLELGPDSPASKEYRKTLKERNDYEATIPMTLVAEEMSPARKTYLFKRGLYDQKGEQVTRHLPAALGALPKDAPKNRLGLAQWLTSPANPLLARVYVNRVWQQHFGTAIVATPEDFGSQGEWPKNQPLLDALAVTFAQQGWSMKKLHRLIVTSAAFRQSSRISKTKLAVDPENRLLSRGPRFRLDAEVIRDKALAAGGLLVDLQGGRGFKPYQPDGIWETASDPASGTSVYRRDQGQTIYRRSLYLFWKRTAPPPAMITFDAPLRDTCVVRRSSTNTPLQALTIQNEPAFLEASRTMAQRLLGTKTNDDDKLKLAYSIAMARQPKPAELVVLKSALDKYRQKYAADPEAAQKLLAVGDAPRAQLTPSEHAAWMLICSTLMNTDEFVSQH